MSGCGLSGNVPNMIENPQDIVDYAHMGIRTAVLVKNAGLFRWFERWVTREPTALHDWQAE